MPSIAGSHPLSGSLKSAAKGMRFLAQETGFCIKKGLGMASIQPPKINKDKSEKISRVLLPMLRHEYGKEEWGDSYEYTHFYAAIKKMAKTELFDFVKVRKEKGARAMNEQLYKMAKSGEYDLILTALMQDDFEQHTIRKISEQTSTLTANWFSDDQWRFSSFSSRWAGAYNFVTTTDRKAVAKYSALGYSNAIRTQWAASPDLLVPSKKSDIDIDVCLVGQRHGGRGKLVEDLRARGINVQAFGSGWASGRIDHQRMVDLFACSRINLSPTESSFYLAPRQMKARVFEVAACGGFQLAGWLEELSDYFLPGKEIGTYADTDDLAIKIRHYLDDENERKAIAVAGKKRTLKEHTYVKRFENIFSCIEKAVARQKRR